MLSLGAAFLVAYLPAHRIAHTGQRGALEAAAGRVAALQKIADNERAKLEARAAEIAQLDERLRGLADVTLPVLPPLSAAPAMATWLRYLPEFMTPRLTTPLLQAAWKAGETARAVAVDVMLASYLAHLRCTAPDDFDLRSQAQLLAKRVGEASVSLQRALEATGVPLVRNYSSEVRTLVENTKDREPTTSAGCEQLEMMAQRVIACIELHGRQLDAPTDEARGKYIPEIIESIQRWDAQSKQPKTPKTSTITLGRFSEGARQVTVFAQKLADDRHHVRLTTTHLLSCLIALPPVKERLAAVGGDVVAAEAAAEAAFAAMPTSDASSYLSDELIALFCGVESFAAEVTLEHLLIACVTLPPRATLEDIDRVGVDTPEEATRRTVITAGHLDRLVPR